LNPKPASAFEAFFAVKPAWQLWATWGAIAFGILFIFIGSIVWCCCCCKKARDLKAMKENGGNEIQMKGRKGDHDQT